MTLPLQKQAERFLQEGLHPRIIADGFDLAKARAIDFLDTFKTPVDTSSRELLLGVAQTSLRTKVAWFPMMFSSCSPFVSCPLMYERCDGN
jgi:chaperonin GroEL (HSP60 family)